MTRKSNSPEGNEATVTVTVWDLPLRLFHWSLVLCIIGSFVTIKVGGGWMVWHMRFGYAVLALLLFRVIWGVIGGRHARFSDFVVSPATLLGYLRNRPGLPISIGHNPLGSLSVIAMIVLFLAQAVSGLFANDDIFTEGPLAHLVSKDTSDMLTGWHKLGEFVLLALVGLHLLAIAFYRFGRGQRLVRAMIVGSKEIPSTDPEAALGAARTTDSSIPADSTGQRITAAIVLAACAGFVYWLVTSF